MKEKEIDSLSFIDENEIVSATLMTNMGKSENDVINWFASNGVKDVEKLANGFLSVNASCKVLKAAEAITTVEIKKKKMPH